MEYFVHCNENAYNSLIIIIMYVERISFFFWNIWKWDFALRDIFSREITNSMIVFFKSRTIFICNKMIMFCIFIFTSAKLIWTNINARRIEKKIAEKHSMKIYLTTNWYVFWWKCRKTYYRINSMNFSWKF